MPAGHFYLNPRLWEAVEAGSIPILQEVKGEYNLCNGSSIHFSATIDGAITLRSWDELPAVLEQVPAPPPTVTHLPPSAHHP